LNKEGLSLKECQKWMKDRIHPARNHATADSNDNILNPQGGVSGLDRLEVYAQGYIARIHEALTESYQAVGQVLGHEMFVKLAEDYANHYPSEDYNLSLAGRHLSSFLKVYDAVRELPFLPDLARLEWEITEAFHAFEHSAESLEMLGSLTEADWEKIKIEFQPHVHILKSDWPVWDIWQVRKEPVEKIKIDLIGRSQQILIYRKDWRVKCESVSMSQFLLLEGLLQSKTLGEAAERLLENESEPLEVSQYFSHWVNNGLIVRAYL
jgi:hypothetical protein